MATRKKPATSTRRKNIPAEVPEVLRPLPRRRQARALTGTIFLLAGAFICLSIASYILSWKADQDMLLNAGSDAFVLKGTAPVQNWGGRLGATLAHTLVYKGFGIASLAAGLWFLLTGLHILWGRRAAAPMRYLRWACLAVLVVAPVMAYIMPQARFPWGGAWGTAAIQYLNGMIGKGGTGLLLAGGVAFVLFVILALDVTPFIRRARRAAKKAREARAAMRAEAELARREKSEAIVPVLIPGAGNMEPVIDIPDDSNAEDQYADDPVGPIFSINEQYAAGKSWDMQQSERVNGVEPYEEEEEGASDDETSFEDPGRVIDRPASEAQTSEDTDDSFGNGGLSFEVVHQPDEAPAAVTVQHGAHISVEAGEPYAPELDLPSYRFPTLDLLEDRGSESISLDKEELEKNKNQIIQTLRSFGIEIQRITATVGPTVTLYEIVPAEGVRISKIRNLEDDIALNLAALGIRIIAPIPGRGTIGIEVPNANKQIVSMRGLLQSEKFVNTKMSLPIALGKKIDNENYIVDLATMPHLLMAGATGQGKSVGINAILVSLLYKKHPSQLKFVLVDPKKVELSIYKMIEKHFLAKLPNEEDAIITDTKKVINTLNALCIEMDNRYELLKEAGTRNIKEYNEKFIARRLNPEKGHKYLPFIVLVVDEFADLIMTAGKEVEMPIARLAQLARAIGIHLIIATQRPSVNVITGTIKANFPARVAFKVSAKVDSRTILDTGGAEQLIGRGDMLISYGSEVLRLQCAFVDTPEVEHIVEFIGKQRGYPIVHELPEYEGAEEGETRAVDLSNRDKMFEDCARLVVSSQSGSTSNIQRKFNFGYNRAGRVMDQLEAAGIVGPAMGSKPREVYFHTEAELEQFLDTIA